MTWYWGQGVDPIYAQGTDPKGDNDPYVSAPGYPDGGGTHPPTDPPPTDPTQPNNVGGQNAYPFLNSEGGYEDPSYGGPSRPSFNFQPVPLFKAPRFVFNEKFKAPTADDVQNEPGFKFRLGQSTGAVERSAAARGVTRSGGTIQDILARAGDFASQEYNNAFNRELQGYQTRFGTARDVYDREFGAAKAEYEPLFQQWSFKSGAERDAAMAQFNQAFQQWLKQQDLALGYAELGTRE